MSSAGTALRPLLESQRRRVDQWLLACLPGPPACPEPLAEAMRYSVMAGGKRLRPILVVLAGEFCDAPEPDLAAAACAVELVHTYSLIHDDLPAMDDDDVRRGKPTSHKVFGEAVAILAGDGLLTHAFEVLARGVSDPAVSARCVAVLADAAGPKGMVAGQVLDMGSAGSGPDAGRVEDVHRRKTGALLTASVALGGLVGRADDDVLERLTRYGRSVGLAFQIVDDLLDTHGDEQTAGKRLGKDAEQGKLTYPGVFGPERSTQRAAMEVESACAAVEPLGERAERLVLLARYIMERNR